MQRGRGGPDAALGAGDGDHLAAERRVRGLLAGDAVAHRPRPLRGGADAGLEGLERDRERDDVAQAGLHRRPQQARRVVRGQQDQPDLGVGGREIARQIEHGRAAERVEEQHDVDVETPQRAVQLVDLARDVDDLHLGLARLGGRAARGLVVGDRDQKPRTQRPGCGSAWSSAAPAGLALTRRPRPASGPPRGRSSPRACARDRRRGAAARAGRRPRRSARARP